jgi:hypothetical protein
MLKVNYITFSESERYSAITIKIYCIKHVVYCKNFYNLKTTLSELNKSSKST